MPLPEGTLEIVFTCICSGEEVVTWTALGTSDGFAWNPEDGCCEECGVSAAPGAPISEPAVSAGR